MALKRLQDIGCVRGRRHRMSLPVEVKEQELMQEPEEDQGKQLQVEEIIF